MNEAFGHLVENMVEQTDENLNILNHVESNFDEYIQLKILDTFLISTLSKKVHPITLGSIKMGANPAYLKYVRNNRNVLSSARNEARIFYCIRMFRHTLIGSTLTEIQNIIEPIFGFVPDRRFCLDALRSYSAGGAHDDFPNMKQ